MGIFCYIFWAVIWLADMTALVLLAPLGDHVMWFSVLFCLGHILMIVLVIKFPPDISEKKAFILIFILGAAARIAYAPYPAGNDVFRYIWEGYIQNHGFNPYVFAPLNPALKQLAHGELFPFWRQINHPEFTAAYPPASLLLFRLLDWLKPSPFFFKFFMAIFDLGVMVLLMQMIRRQGLAPSRLLFYAANPLVLVYIAGEGHLDVVQVFFLLLSLYLILYRERQFWGFLMLGIAALSKYFALAAWPFLVKAENRWKSLAAFIPLLLYVPFIENGVGPYQLLDSLGRFAQNFHYNDSLAVLSRLLFGDRHLLAGTCILIVCLALVYLLVHDRLRSVYLALGCLLLFLPTLHPWYLVLIAPFLVFFPSLAWLYLSAAVVFTFPVIAVESQTGIFQEIFWLKLFEYIPFYGFLIWGLFRDGYLMRDRSYPKPNHISVIIPALNEESNIGRCLDSLKPGTLLREIIVADGGSKDKTRSIAAKRNVRVIESMQGRGLQIKAGIEAACGDVILILHADCRVAEGVFERIIELLRTRRSVVGGAFGMQFDTDSLKNRSIAFLNNLRALLTGISFGDQAQFFRAEALNEMGALPPMMLMEDVDLALRLKEIGRLVFFRKGITVSDRRWNGIRIAGKLGTVFYLFTRYLIERRWGKIDRAMRNYYDIYYAGTDRLRV